MNTNSHSTHFKTKRRTLNVLKSPESKVQKFERQEQQRQKVPTANGERRMGGTRVEVELTQGHPTTTEREIRSLQSPSTGITLRASITFGSASRRSARGELTVYPLGPTSFKEGESAHAPGTPNQAATYDVARPFHCWRTRWLRWPMARRIFQSLR